MPQRAVVSLLVTLGLLLAWAAPALAVGTDDGEGWVGEANDRVITFMSLGVIIFFPLVALLLSLLQSALERRKERRKHAASERQSGW